MLESSVRKVLENALALSDGSCLAYLVNRSIRELPLSLDEQEAVQYGVYTLLFGNMPLQNWRSVFYEEAAEPHLHAALAIHDGDLSLRAIASLAWKVLSGSPIR